MTKTIDIEEADPPQLGDFTKDWVEYNCNTTNNICWTEKGRTVKAIYGVSKRWSDYTLHLPTGSDVAKHWMLYSGQCSFASRILLGAWRVPNTSFHLSNHSPLQCLCCWVLVGIKGRSYLKADLTSEGLNFHFCFPYSNTQFDPL